MHSLWAVPFEGGRMFSVVLGLARERSIVLLDTWGWALNMEMCFLILLSEKCWCLSGKNYLVCRGLCDSACSICYYIALYL